MGKDKKARKAARKAAAAPPPPPVPAPLPAEPVGMAPSSAGPAPLPPLIDAGRVSFGLSRLANALGGATLCYGEPVRVGERVVVPVARVRGAGGFGFGRGSSTVNEDQGDGGGGGGAVEASPAGFLDITPDGVRFEAIRDPVTSARALSTGASALAMLVTAAVGARQASRRRRTAGRLLR